MMSSLEHWNFVIHSAFLILVSSFAEVYYFTTSSSFPITFSTVTPSASAL